MDATEKRLTSLAIACGVRCEGAEHDRAAMRGTKQYATRPERRPAGYYITRKAKR